MRIPAISLLLLATAAAGVSAAPAREETTGRVSYNDRAKGPVAPSGNLDPSDGWVELASATPASNGREFIEVATDTRSFTQLRLKAVSGRPAIRAVRIDYGDGSRRTFEVARVLVKHRPAYLDLHGAREVREIVVITDRSSPGSYVLEGNVGEGGVAVASRR
jgi:hypothetical protein